MVEFKRKKGESFESFLRRFNKALIQSRKLKEVRGRQYQKKAKNKNQQKKYALVSKQMREKKESVLASPFLRTCSKKLNAFSFSMGPNRSIKPFRMSSPFSYPVNCTAFLLTSAIRN